MEANGYHPYRDSTGFIYLIVLARRDILKNMIERHRIKVRYSSPCPFAMRRNPSPRSRHTTTYMHITCHLQHFRFPRPYAFSKYPVIGATPPRRLIYRPSCAHRKLRVPIPNPWAHCLQLFESDSTPHRYASYLAYTAGRPGIKSQLHDLAPVGATGASRGIRSRRSSRRRRACRGIRGWGPGGRTRRVTRTAG
jgi:hypothetical protein